MSGFSEFWAGRELWREPLLGGVLAAALLSYLGVFVVLKRMVFVSAALSEISSVGVAFAFYVGAVAGIDPHAHGAVPLLLEPTWFSLLFASLAAALFSLPAGSRLLARETIVGLVYVISSAAVLAILNSPRIAQEAHAVGDILFGNAVVVPREQIWALAAAGAAAILVHVLFFKEFLYVSYDPETAVVQGIGVFRYELLLNMATAVVISVATRAVGALPVFAFTVIPAAAALMITERMGKTIALSIFFGVVAASVGYYFSWVEQLPTGASMVIVASVFLVPGFVRILRRKTG
ncbi:MAG TPA: iron chelate uptake ABC transporter family permease subunit [Myxococcales bacterium]